MTNKITKHSGSCLCGAIEFSFTSSLDKVWFCHCSQCRKNYGMYGAFVGIPRESFSINKTKKLHSYKSSPDINRTFCSVCGSSIAWDKKDSGHIYILAGLLDGKIKITKGNHMFTKNKGGYYKICDDLQQYKTTLK